MSDKAGSYYSPLNQMRISSEVFGAYLNCPTKSWLRAADHPPTGSAYSEWLKAQNDSYRTTEREQLAAESANDEVALSSDRENTKSGRWCLAPGLAVQVKMDSCVLESELHAVQRVPAKGRGKPVQLIPIRFAFKNKLARDDRLLLAFDAFVLSKSLGREVTIGKIIHGDERAAMTVKTSALAGEVRKRIEKITALLSSPTPPDLVLNRHCAECEFQVRCRRNAIEKDDLSLLSSMTEKERKRLHGKGIFTGPLDRKKNQRVSDFAQRLRDLQIQWDSNSSISFVPVRKTFTHSLRFAWAGCQAKHSTVSPAEESEATKY